VVWVSGTIQRRMAGQNANRRIPPNSTLHTVAEITTSVYSARIDRFIVKDLGAVSCRPSDGFQKPVQA